MAINNLYYKTFHILIIFLIQASNLLAQAPYNIKEPKRKFDKKCREFIHLLNNKPASVRMGIEVDKKGNIFLVATDKNWIESVFSGKGDGVAVDIILKSRYDCDAKDRSMSFSGYKGFLLQPVYSINLLKLLNIDETGLLRAKIGTIPDNYKNKEYECNLVMIKNFYFCSYKSFVSIKSYNQIIPNIGLFMLDSLYNFTTSIQNINQQSHLEIKNKQFKFNIPVKKNNITFLKEEMDMLFNSVINSGHSVKNIKILAYAAVGDIHEQNFPLLPIWHQEIANSISTLQKFPPAIDISINDNWVEFMNDISRSEFSNLTRLPKSEIRETLAKPIAAGELKHILENHRKVILVLEAVKKYKHSPFSPEKLVSKFNQLISDSSIDSALMIQKLLFHQIMDHSIDISCTNYLKIPYQKMYTPLLHNLIILDFIEGEHDTLVTIQKLRKLKEIAPNDYFVHYNYCILSLLALSGGDTTSDFKTVKDEIDLITSNDIPDETLQMVKLNYRILLSSYFKKEGNEINMAKVLDQIYSMSREMLLTESDRLHLANYFVSFGKYEWAILLLSHIIDKIDVDEDLIFYYLNLTLLNSNLTSNQNYRTTMFNGLNLNKERFCRLFNASINGGISFQLLENNNLKDTYCEHCK